MTARRVLSWILGAVALPGTSLAGQDSLPSAVASAFHQAYPAARVLHVSKERRDGNVAYEIESRDGDTRRDLIYSPAGAVLEIEEQIPVDSVPAVVRAAAERRVAGGTLVGAERVTRGTVILFEVQLRLNGRSRFLTYDPEGRPVD
jgi:hypothetical protein